MTDSPSSRWTRWDILVVFLVLAGSVWLSRLPFHPPDPVGTEAPDTAFSSARALEHLQVIARAPHLPGSPEHERVRGYLLEQLRTLGLEAEYHQATWVRRRGQGNRAVALWNVVGRLPGTDPTGAVLLMAHYDPVPLSSGANDDGSSVAAILEAVRAIRAGPPLRNDLIVLLSDGEELGLMGARAFVDGHRWFPDVSVVLNFEAKGDDGVSLMFETRPENGWVVRALAEADPHPVGNSLSLAVYQNMPNDTDYSPFRDAGVQGLNFSSIGGPNLYHQAFDDLDHTSPPTIQHQGLHVLSMARHLGNEELSMVEGREVAFASLPLLGLIYYPPGWNWLGVVLAIVLAGTTAVVGLRQKELGIKGVFAGFGMGIIALVLSAGLSREMFRNVRDFHGEYGLLHGSAFHAEGWYFLAVVALTLAVLLGAVGLLRRWFRIGELAWGGALIPLLGAVALAWWLPLAAMNLVWPVLFGEAALLWYLIRLQSPPESGKTRIGRLLILGLLMLPVVIFLWSSTEVLWVALSISQARELGVLITITLLLLLPLLAPLEALNRWWAPTVAGVLVLLFVGLGILNSSATPDRPTPTPLYYVMDRDQGVAWWVTASDSEEEWLRARVPSTERVDHDEAFLPQWVFFASADPVEAELPLVELVRDTIREGRRHLRIAISSRIGAEILNVKPAGESGAVLHGVNDREVGWTGEAAPGEGGVGWPLQHWGDPGGPVTVDFSVPEEVQTVELLLEEGIYHGAEALLGPEAFARPPHLVSSIVGRSDVAVFGSRIRF
ncbi:MAG: M20/M25/M40 family metallo-hydrolase [Gemmatimonadetes bacterium]|nr:M20/M25/M40 family metallo-hydrolase [Gemmatimonadota bacterium]